MASSFQKQLERAEIAERLVRDYLNVLGWKTIAAADYRQKGAPKLEAANPAVSTTQTDILGFKDGCGSAFDCKLKSRAIPRCTHGCRRAGCQRRRPHCTGKLYTGIDEHAYNQYRQHERDSGMPSVLIFLHEEEDEVRCATLDTLDMFKAPGCSADQHGKGGMRNWWFEQIPLWMKYSELKLFAEAYRRNGKANWFGIEPPLRESLRPPKPEIQPSLFGANWGRR